MAEAGYKSLVSYKLAEVAFRLGWEIVPILHPKYEEARQRDQIKQALRSCKQNIVEGSAQRSLSGKLKLYDVAKASCMEVLEDFEDILRLRSLPKWAKDDRRLRLLRGKYELHSNPSNPSRPPNPTLAAGIERLEELEGLEGLEWQLNYLIDVLIRCGYLLDRQIRAVEEKHAREGGYRENLLQRRLNQRQNFSA